MDKFNPSHSAATYWLMRMEHLAIVAFCTGVALWQWDALNLWHFSIVFLMIDAFGYLPGLVAYLRHGRAKIHRMYHYAYNLTHSYLFWGLVVALWWAVRDWEWAMLAVPIHLSGDRGVFGNVFKPADRSFEPAPPAGQR